MGKRDANAFRERFNRWKNGELVYDKGRPIDLSEYEGGKESKLVLHGSSISLKDIFKKAALSRLLREVSSNDELNLHKLLNDSFIQKTKKKARNFVADDLYNMLSKTGGEIPNLWEKGVKYTGSYWYPAKSDTHSQVALKNSWDNGPRRSYIFGGKNAVDERDLVYTYTHKEPKGLKYLRNDAYVLGGDTLYNGPVYEGKIFPLGSDSVYNVTSYVKPMLDSLIKSDRSLRVNMNNVVVDSERFPILILDNVKHARLKPIKEGDKYYLKATKLWDMGGTLGLIGKFTDTYNKIGGGSPFLLEQKIPISFDNDPTHEYSSDWKFIENTLVNLNNDR